MSSKSYWQSVYIGSDNAKAAVKSHFAPLCNDMTPERADILCDKETDREKKLRAIMIDTDGSKYRVTRTVGRNYSIKLERLPASAP